ncbi:hypothetical protein TraAM80_02494 [Trypanosoma rangeli]|uniref:Uncharacterized protein n=1 Tax=Trypanosoma rangeli TaxID=5698 RepID=A0A3R7MVV7_TRYRA|nr:uncharacterized protein TraAM80_02494 [Trypanosoma rangeli]RNF08861.1 hypothetical protein TraAM80_02494 [Trypanosoma rangeli]|eukprot:RNF08861.1 hypothetical protein TraAM80_02494 [Trypanosoma rangeli]
MNKPNGRTDSSESLAGLSCVISEACKNGCTDLLKRYHNQLIHRLLALSSLIIEATSMALRTDVMSTSAPSVERHEDPEALLPRSDPGTQILVPGNVHENDTCNNNNGNKRRELLPSTRERAFRMPVFVTPRPDVGPTMSQGTSSVVTINVSAITSLNTAPSRLHLASSTMCFLKGELFDASGRRSSGLMYPIGMRERGPLFVQDEALTDEEMRATLSLVAQAGSTDKKRQELQHPYYELLCVRSCELTVSVSPTWSSHSIENEGRCVHAGCFTKAIYARHPTGNEGTATATVIPQKSIKGCKQRNVRGASLQRPLLTVLSLTSTPDKSQYLKSERNGRRSAVLSKSKIAVKATEAANVAAAKAIEGESVLTTVWHPVTPSMDSGDGVHCTRFVEGAGSQPKCHKENSCVEENTLGEEDKFMGEADAAQFILRTEERVYTLHYTVPLSTQRKEANDKHNIGCGNVSPIRISLVSSPSL